jgi:hypothetical protein
MGSREGVLEGRSVDTGWTKKENVFMKINFIDNLISSIVLPRDALLASSVSSSLLPELVQSTPLPHLLPLPRLQSLRTREGACLPC